MLLALLALSCPLTLVVNNTKEWTVDDQHTLDNAKKRCGELYPDAPCLTKFEKTAALAYRAYCGEEEK